MRSKIGDSRAPFEVLTKNVDITSRSTFLELKLELDAFGYEFLKVCGVERIFMEWCVANTSFATHIYAFNILCSQFWVTEGSWKSTT
jgi:hypothetical protein